MQFDKFKKLEQKINNQNFNQGYKTINIVMLVLSVIGHFTAIFLSYFALSKILNGVIENNVIIVGLISIIVLSGLELLKRDIFDKFSNQYLKIKKFNKDVIPLALLSLTIIGVSFYASINGAMEFSSKQDIIEMDMKISTNAYKDSLNVNYNVNINKIVDEIDKIKEKIDLKDRELTDLTNSDRPSRTRMNDLKKDKEVLRSDIIKLENDIINLKKEQNAKIDEYENEIGKETENKKKDNNTNSIAFIILSTLIEIIILAGVYFNDYYKYRSYIEYRDKIEKDPYFQKWILYNKILDVIYKEDTNINEKLPPMKNIIELARINNVILLQKDLTDFFKAMNGMGIIKISGPSKYINKPKDVAIEQLKKQFNIK